MTPEQARQVLAESDLIHDAATVEAAIHRLAREITAALGVIFRRRLHQLTGRNARCAGDS